MDFSLLNLILPFAVVLDFVHNIIVLMVSSYKTFGFMSLLVQCDKSKRDFVRHIFVHTAFRSDEYCPTNSCVQCALESDRSKIIRRLYRERYYSTDKRGMQRSIDVLSKNKDPKGPQCFVVLKLGEASAAVQTRVNDVYTRPRVL